MVKVNSISGGRTSSYLAVHYPADHNVFSVVCLDDPACTVKDKVVLRYAQDKLASFVPDFGEFIATAEDDATLRVMMDLEQILGTEITWVRGLSFDKIIDEGGQHGLPTRLPSWARRYCTSNMKLLPIFLWWFKTIGVKCEMRLGFRFDEFPRMERFFNNSDPCNFRIPIACKLTGEHRQVKEEFNWRYCAFPLVRDGIEKHHVDEYWRGNGWTDGDLFAERRQIRFPSISNCIGCFHKRPETLAAMADMHPEKFRWFIDQEQKGKGTWLDSRVTYQHLLDHRFEIAKEAISEAQQGYIHGYSLCDSGGCTD